MTSAPDNVEPRCLVQWLGQKAGVTPDRARDLLELYARRRERDVYFSHTAQEAHNESLARQARKTILVTAGAPRNPAVAVELSCPPSVGQFSCPTIRCTGARRRRTCCP